jgi:hypothetical protein
MFFWGVDKVGRMTYVACERGESDADRRDAHSPHGNGVLKKHGHVHRVRTLQDIRLTTSNRGIV